MGRSLRVSQEGLKRAKEAFNLTGVTQEYLAGSVKCSRQSVINFFARGPVEKRIFEALCIELKLTVAEIADLESEEGLVNTFVSVNGNEEQSLATLTQKETETDEERAAFAATGTIAKSDIPKVKAILALLQEITGDTSIKIVDIEKGSIRLILEGSQESLEQIETLFKSGQLTEVEGIPVEDVQFVTPKIPEHDEDVQAIDKKRLAFTLAGSVSSEEIQELKAAFTETLDNDEEIEADDKARLVQEIINKRARGRNLSSAYLSGADVSGADVSSAYLSGADLSGVDLRGAFLRGADLRGADLRGADLSGANLSGAYLNNAGLLLAFLMPIDLTIANLIIANLIRIRLIHAELIRTNLGGANLSGANLRGANLRDANLSGANLRGANLGGANLSGANLRGANLRDANLSGANLRDANLSGANLSGANLRDANLRGAVVEKAKFGANLGLTKEMKLDLKQRGAIFEDSPGDRSGILSRR